jgi:hypothetical protein
MLDNSFDYIKIFGIFNLGKSFSIGGENMADYKFADRQFKDCDVCFRPNGASRKKR